MQKNLYIGLMSGTSLDGVDAVVVEFSPSPCCIAHHHLPYDDALRKALTELLQPGANEIERAGRLAIDLAHLYAQVINEMLALHKIDRRRVVCAGVHGQTIRHCPAEGFTVQLNNPAVIAELTGIDIVADFRSRDLAAGGEGAPLVPAFHADVFAGDLDRAIVNIGGIANISLIAAQNPEACFGFDCGPGNTLLDCWTQAHRGENMDRNAQWAKTGKIHTGLLESFLEDDYFSRPWPKSTGRELFNMDWIRCALFDHPNVAPEDVQRTLVRLTAQTIWDAIHAAQPSTREIYVCGGGVFNPVLMLDLAELSQRSIQSTRALGIDPMHVEACAFAWLAWAFDKKKAGNLPAVTRAAGPRILGALYPA